MKPLSFVVVAGALLVPCAPALAHTTWSFGISYGPAAFYYGPYAPRPYYGPRSYYGYPVYYGYPRYYRPYPVYGAPVYYPYAPPPASYYPPRYAYAVPPPPRPAPRAQPAQPQKQAAIPPRMEKITLAATELFEFDKDKLREPQPKLDEIASLLKENPQISGITITGYTDRLGESGYNMALSKRRAEAVKYYLVRQGIAGDRLNAIPKGEADPVVQCHQKDEAALIKCLEPNRRVVIEPITLERKMDPASAPAEGRRAG